jgi:PEP-CTERM motif
LRSSVEADPFVSTDAGASAGNSVLKLVDSAGFNQTINLGTTTTLYTAPAAATVKGVEFAPVAVPEPSSFALAGLGGLLMVRVMRKRARRLA